MSTHRDIQPATDEQVEELALADISEWSTRNQHLVDAVIVRLRNAEMELEEERVKAAHQGDLIARLRDVVEEAIGYVTSTDSFTTSYRTLDAPLREAVRDYLAENPLDVA